MDREEVIALLREVLTIKTYTEYGYYSDETDTVYLIIEVDGVQVDQVRVSP